MPLSPRIRVALVVHVRLLLCAAGVAMAAAGCPDGETCGNGEVDDGETEATCCADTGCAFGACEKNACVLPWDAACDAGACAGPYVCAGGGAPPTYDCGACTCGNADACIEGACLDAFSRNFARSGTVVEDTLDLDEYTRLYTDLGAQQKITVADAVAEIATAMQADPRVNTIVYGAVAGSQVAVIDDAVERALPFRATRTPLADPSCDELRSSSSSSLLPQELVVASVPLDAASKETCPYRGTFPACDLPAAADCVVSAARFPITFVILDELVTLPLLDDALLLRAARSSVEQEGPTLDTAFSLFTSVASLVRADAGLVVNNRVAAVWHGQDPHTYFVILADANAKPLHIGSFRVLWNDAPARDFLVQNQITSRDCEFDVDAGIVHVLCTGNNGAQLDAHVDAGNFSLVDVDTAGP